jgi:hypothetical protein
LWLTQTSQDAGTSPVDAPHVNADVSATFPDADIFGVKLVNGRPTKAVVTVANREKEPIQFAFIAGTLAKPVTPAAPDAAPVVLRNLTAVRYNLEVAAGETREVPFSFSLDMQPQDVTLQLTAVLSSKGSVFSVPVYSGPAAVVEPPTSFFDPQM